MKAARYINNNSKNSIQNIFAFLNNYKISQLDAQTLILTNRKINQNKQNKENDLQGYMIKDISIQTQQQLNQIENTLKLHLGFPSSLFMILIDYQIIQQHKSYFIKSISTYCPQLQNNTQVFIRAIYQHSQYNLLHELTNRALSKQSYLEDQLWFILTSAVQSLAYLQKNEVVYGVLGLDRMLITFNKDYKSINKNTSPINNCVQQLSKKKLRLLDPSATTMNPLHILPNRLYSPQVKIYSYQKNGFQSSQNMQQSNLDQLPMNIDMFKSDVYVLGLCLLQLGLLNDFVNPVNDQTGGFSTIHQQKSQQQSSIMKNIQNFNRQRSSRQQDQDLNENIDKCSNDSFNPKKDKREIKQNSSNQIKFSNIISKNKVGSSKKSQIFQTNQDSLKKSKSLHSQYDQNLQLTIPFHLAEFTHNYSQELTTLISAMLQGTPENRPSFSQIQQHLQKLNSMKNIPGLSIALERQVYQLNKNQSSTFLQPLKNDQQCESDKSPIFENFNQFQNADWKDQDVEELQNEKSQKRKRNLKHSLPQKQKHCKKQFHGMTEYEKARQNFCKNNLRYQEENSSQTITNTDNSCSPKEQSSCSDEKSFHQSSNGNLKFRQRKRKQQSSTCCKCSKQKRKQSISQSRKSSVQSRRSSKCECKTAHANNKILICRKKQNPNETLKFNSKKLKKKSSIKNQSRKISRQASFKQLLSQNDISHNKKKLKTSYQKQSSSSNSQPSSLMSSYQDKNSKSKHDLNQNSYNKSMMRKNNNHQNGKQILRQTQQFKTFLNANQANYIYEIVDQNQQTKSKNITKDLKDKAMNLKPVTREIFNHSLKKNQNRYLQNRQNLNQCLQKCLSSRQLQKIQSHQSQEQSESSIDDQYPQTCIDRAESEMRHIHNENNKYPKPQQIQTFYQAKIQYNHSNNANTFKQAIYLKNTNKKANSEFSQEKPKPSLIIKPKNYAFIRTINIEAKKQEQIFTDPNLLKMIKNEIKPIKEQDVSLKNYEQPQKMRQTLGQTNFKSNYSNSKTFISNAYDEKESKKLTAQSEQKIKFNTLTMAQKENKRYNQISYISKRQY